MKEKQKNEIHGNRKQQKLVGVQLRDGGGPGDLKSHSGVHLIWNTSQETLKFNKQSILKNNANGMETETLFCYWKCKIVSKRFN